MRGKLDNKGIAISGIMYMILMICILLILGTLKTMQNRKVIIDKLKSDTEEELESSIPTLKASDGTSGPKFLGGGVDKLKYESVATVSSNKVPSDVIDSWDVSEEQNGAIMAWYLDEDNDNMYELYIGQDGGVIANPDSRYLFAHFNKVVYIDLSNFDTSHVTDMSHMFHSYDSTTIGSKIISLDLSNFDTSNVTDMSHMFQNCSSLTSLDVSNFDTSNVTDMSYMFAANYALTSLDVSHFNTSNVTTMELMFYADRSLTSLDLSNFDTSNVTNMNSMFQGTTSLTNLNISEANFNKVTSYGDMFRSSKVSTIYVKDNTAKSFINSRLSAAGLSATVIIDSLI